MALRAGEAAKVRVRTVNFDVRHLNRGWAAQGTHGWRVWLGRRNAQPADVLIGQPPAGADAKLPGPLVQRHNRATLDVQQTLHLIENVVYHLGYVQRSDDRPAGFQQSGQFHESLLDILRHADEGMGQVSDLIGPSGQWNELGLFLRAQAAAALPH